MIITALWKDSYKITVGDKECGEIETKEDEITCLPPVSEPTDALADNPTVRVGFARCFLFRYNTWHCIIYVIHIDIYFNKISSAYQIVFFWL